LLCFVAAMASFTFCGYNVYVNCTAMALLPTRFRYLALYRVVSSRFSTAACFEDL
jgi:hypothetical protein